MKLPTGFIQENKGYGESIEDLLKRPKLDYNPETVSNLLDLGEEFLEKTNNILHYQDVYDTGIKIAGDVSYTLKAVKELSKKIKIKCEEDRWLGLYLSALINKIITEKDRAQARQYFTDAQQLIFQYKYNEAFEKIEKSLEIDPNNKQAKEIRIRLIKIMDFLEKK